MNASISAKTSLFLAKIIVLFPFLVVQKKAKKGRNGQKNIFFGLLLFLAKPQPVKKHFSTWIELSAFGVILTMQLERPKRFVAVNARQQDCIQGGVINVCSSYVVTEVASVVPCSTLREAVCTWTGHICSKDYRAESLGQLPVFQVCISKERYSSSIPFGP